MMEQEPAISPEISKLRTMSVGPVSFRYSLRKGHGLCGFSDNTNMVKVNGVVYFVLQGNHNQGITGYRFVNWNVDTQKKGDKEKAEKKHRNDLGFFRHESGSDGFFEWGN